MGQSNMSSQVQHMDLHSLTVNQNSETASNSGEKVILGSYGRSSFLNLQPCEEVKQTNNEYEQDEDSSEDEEFYR